MKAAPKKLSRNERLLRTADRLLGARHGTPFLGNKRHPVSELVYIILSARTRGVEHEAFYRRLRRSFRTWEAVRDANIAAIERVIHDARPGAHAAPERRPHTSSRR
jgi:endonuclease III